MMAIKKPSPDDPAQSKRFVEAAKDVEADASGTAFKRALDLIIPAKRKLKKRLARRT